MPLNTHMPATHHDCLRLLMRFVRVFSLWALGAAVLTGCAMAPGASFQRFQVNTNVNPLLKLLGDEPEEAPPPPGAITRITPDLVRALRAVPQADPLAPLRPFLTTPGPYRMGASDILDIVVWGFPEFSFAGASVGGTSVSSSTPISFVVSPQGTIQFPYLGLVKAGGLTEQQLRDDLTTRLKQLVKDPQVTVRVQAYRAARVYVDGEVRTPGQQAINDVPMTLPEALSRAGGLAPTADRSNVSSTRGEQTVRINLELLAARGIDPRRIALADNDLLRVGHREDTKVYVMGEVSRPSSQFFRKDGRLTLHEALGEAGGVNSTSADPRQVYVVRVSEQGADKAQIFHLDAGNPMALALAEGFELQPKDVVYVDPVPLVRWNRVISLILPSAQAVSATRSALN